MRSDEDFLLTAKYKFSRPLRLFSGAVMLGVSSEGAVSEDYLRIIPVVHSLSNLWC